MDFDWSDILVPVSALLMGLYALALLLIFLYAISQLSLLINYVRNKNKTDQSPRFDLNDTDQVPYVTIQLPVYNELYVIERLLNHVSKIEYPRDKFEVQVLDDSTDESVSLTSKQISELQKTGLDIVHVRRTNRTGFKAGALKEGLQEAKGEFVAIFDADFVPGTDWLFQTVPYFKDKQVGVVQTRWGHINRDYSLLTQVQAFALDIHFTLEQVGRNSGGHFINFNGTAGVWRKSCIVDAGNWEGDTLTEDLDLSYRAQLKGWKFKYLEDVETPAELPVVMSAVRSQQFRWNKGGAENFQKMIRKIFQAKNIDFKTRLHAIMHLLNSSMFFTVLVVSILSIPMLYIKNEWGHFRWFFDVTSLFIISTIIFFICYWHTFKRIHGKGFTNFLTFTKQFVTFYAVAIGFSVHNSVAVLEGHLRKRSEFIRTPKFNIGTFKDNFKTNKYLQKNISKSTIVEGLLTLYFLFGMYSAFVVGPEGDFGLFPFHMLLFFGFGFIVYSSVKAKV
ncbi:MAG: glycosyltransferase [Flavobacteriaceae bacterium]|nr:glycosyltransferase [Flavobacteriaceae bacterium]